MITIAQAAEDVQRFEGGSLTNRIALIEGDLVGLNGTACQTMCATLGATPSLLDSALVLKRVAGQINVLIHAVGILVSLPYVLQESEVIESLSLGAGSTGKPFDLETDRRIAEFKFINWRGGTEAIRQNQLFKDFYLLAEYETTKERYLYVLGTTYPLRFLRGGRALQSVFSRNNKLWSEFQQRYGGQFSRVREYYSYRKSHVQLVDLTKVVPQLPMTLDSESL